MVRPERDRISGEVEVDETYIGGLEEGRGAGRLRDSSKSIVVGAVEIRGRGSGRVRLRVVDDLSSVSLVGFLEESVVPGSVVYTDGWGGYRPLANKGYDHRSQTQGSTKNAAKHFPQVHRAFSNLKTWLARAPITASGSNTYSTISTSMCSVSTGDARPWQPFNRSSDSPATTNRLHTTCCMMVSQPDRQKSPRYICYRVSGSSPELCVKVRGSSSMLRLGCLGDLLRFEKREIEVAAFAPDRSSPQSNRGDEAERTGSVGEGAGAPDPTLDLGVQALEAVRGA